MKKLSHIRSISRLEQAKENFNYYIDWAAQASWLQLKFETTIVEIIYIMRSQHVFLQDINIQVKSKETVFNP